MRGAQRQRGAAMGNLGELFALYATGRYVQTMPFDSPMTRGLAAFALVVLAQVVDPPAHWFLLIAAVGLVALTFSAVDVDGDDHDL